MADPRALLQKADKAAAGAGGGFSLFGGRTEKWENAADLYTQAANAFRVQKLSTLRACEILEFGLTEVVFRSRSRSSL